MRKTCLALFSSLGVLVMMPFASQIPDQNPASSAWKTAWSYEGAKGPEHWGDLDPGYASCRDGKEQSPIDIRGAEKAALPPLQFEYKNGGVNIINNGYTAVRIDYIHSGDYLVVRDKRYELTQFHFHHPSEESIQGKQYDMVLHLMHASKDGRVVGVAVLLKAGRANPTIRKLWEHMPTSPGKLERIPGLELNPAALLPVDTGYYTYSGSLTAPPCAEGVTWFVLKTPTEISTRQIDTFAKLYPHNVRPAQPLNDRVVKQTR